MTVAQLREALEGLDGDSLVIVGDGLLRDLPLSVVEVVAFNRDNGYTYAPEVNESLDELFSNAWYNGAVPAVRLIGFSQG